MMKYLKVGIGLTLACMLFGSGVAQETPQISEDGAQVNADAGPVRIARISFLKGQVSWRESADGQWADAAVNMPLREGAQIWTSDRARAEIQFDDGTYLRLGGVRRDEGGVITLHTMFSDSQGEFTDIEINSGLISLRLTNPTSVYQIDTEFLSAKAAGPADLRIGEGRGIEVVDHKGTVNVKNKEGDSSNLEGGESIFVSDGSSPLQIAPMIGQDAWDKFVTDRDAAIAGQAPGLPQNIALCAGELNGNGTWAADNSYGQVWYPTVVSTWAPYRDGQWVWVRPFGWTWCANEPWGWAPYHFGTWVHLNRGWAWVPGPATQCWSPAVVHFVTVNGRVVWCPLAPSEVRYQNGNVGVWRNGWTLSFSIGSVGSYYPGRDNLCDARYFPTSSVNHPVQVDTAGLNTLYGSGAVVNDHFVPTNAKHGFGASYEAVGEFGRDTKIATWRDTAVFDQGSSFAPGHDHPVCGPPGVTIHPISLAPTHTPSDTVPLHLVFQRPIYRPILPNNGFDRSIPRIIRPIRQKVVTTPMNANPPSTASNGFTPTAQTPPPAKPRPRPIVVPVPPKKDSKPPKHEHKDPDKHRGN